MVKGGDIPRVFSEMREILDVHVTMRNDFNSLYSLLQPNENFFEIHYQKKVQEIKNALIDKISNAASGTNTILQLHLMKMLKYFSGLQYFLSDREQSDLDQKRRDYYGAQSVTDFALSKMKDKIAFVRNFVSSISAQYNT